MRVLTRRPMGPSMGKEAMIGSLCSSASAGLRRRAIKKARRMTIRISDHAMLRWIERVRGFDLTKDRAEIGVAEARWQRRHAEGAWSFVRGSKRAPDYNHARHWFPE